MKLLLLHFAALIPLLATAAGAGAHDDESDHSTPRCGARDGLTAGPRVSALQRERQAKCADLKPYDSAFLERQILAVEKAERPRIDRVNFLGFYPRIQAIDHRSQMAGGVRFWQPDLGRSPLDLAGSAFWSIEGFRFHEAHVGLLPHRGQDFPAFSYRTDDVFELPNVRQDDNSRFVLYANVAHRWAPQFDFYGLGADSRQEDHADFSSKDTLVEAVAGYRILPHVTVSARAGYHEVSTGPGEDETLPQVEDVFEPAEIPGFGKEPEFVRVGLSVVLDRRDVAKNPHRGGLLSVQWLGYDQRNDGAFSFDRLAADARLYLPIGHPQRVLALRAYASTDEPREKGGQVPFNLQAFLGGSHTLRAYASQRFRGEKLVLLQAEYRIEAAPAIEVALFADSAAVGERSGEDLGRFRTDGGVGVRFKSHERTALRFDFAWGDEGFRFLFRFSPSF